MIPVATPAYYRDSAEVEMLARALPEMFPRLCELIELPHETIEHRRVVAVRVGANRSASRSVLITGNMHARELGGAEFCLYLAYNLCQAYTENDGLLSGARTHTADEIRNLLATMDLIIVPCVNPDGRDWSLAGALEGNHAKALWRGNRNIWHGYPPSEARACNGVNLNRNQNFLWDHLLHFSSGANVAASADPCLDHAQNYRGSAAVSEPEARNIVFLMDRFPTLKAYLDIHCAYGAIVHPWGDDKIQTTDPAQNFQNAEHDGRRDPANTDYGEYMPEADLNEFRRLARAFQESLASVRGTTYEIVPAAELGAFRHHQYGHIIYSPTSGATDDYAYSRHFVDTSSANIFAFTIEFGSRVTGFGDEEEVASFQPSWGWEMTHICRELISGTIGFCQAIPGPAIRVPPGCLGTTLMLLGALTLSIALIALL